MSVRKIYISGPVTGTDDYLERFCNAETDLRKRGYVPLNPARVMAQLPEETEYQEYLDVSLSLLSLCDEIYLLSGWENSNGSSLELAYAKAFGMDIHDDDLLE